MNLEERLARLEDRLRSTAEPLSAFAVSGSQEWDSARQCYPDETAVMVEPYGGGADFPQVENLADLREACRKSRRHLTVHPTSVSLVDLWD